MKISVIITTYNRRQLLERSLASLATQNLPANEFELIVVDDGSADATVDLLRSLALVALIAGSSCKTPDKLRPRIAGCRLPRVIFCCSWMMTAFANRISWLPISMPIRNLTISW